MEKRWTIGFIAILCSMLVFTGCQKKTDKPAGKEKILLGMSFPGMQDAAWVAMKKNLEKFAVESETPIDLIFTGADYDVVTQAADIKDLISKRCNVLLMFPMDSKAISSSVKEARDAGIPVMTYCRPVHPDAEYQADVFVGIDAEDQAYSSLKTVLEKMKKDKVEPKGVIIVSGDLHDENSVLRVVGFKKACKEYGVELLQDVPANWDPQQAASGLSAALKAHPEANIIASCSDAMQSGIISALESADKWHQNGDSKHVYFATVDVFPAAIEYIEQKYIDADTLYDVVNMSKNAIKVAIQLANGEKFDSDLLIKGPVYTPENIKDPELKALLW